MTGLASDCTRYKCRKTPDKRQRDNDGLGMSVIQLWVSLGYKDNYLEQYSMRYNGSWLLPEHRMRHESAWVGNNGTLGLRGSQSTYGLVVNKG